MSSSFPPQPPQQPPFGSQPPFGGQQPPFGGYPSQNPMGGPNYPKSNKAVTALVLVIVGFLCCGPFTAVPAIFVAKSEMDAIKIGQADPSNQTLAQVSFWCGIVLSALYVLLFALWILVFGASLAAIPLSNL